MWDDLKCSACDKDARFNLELEEDIFCAFCNHKKFAAGEKLVLCNLKCQGLYGYCEEHKYDFKAGIVRVGFSYSLDECIGCGRADVEGGYFSGPFCDLKKAANDYNGNNGDGTRVRINFDGPKYGKRKGQCQCTDNQKCMYCNSKIIYKLLLSHDISCPDCNALMYVKDKVSLNVCSTQCVKNPWLTIEYLTPQNNPTTIINCINMNNQCTKCKKISDPIAKFVGTRI